MSSTEQERDERKELERRADLIRSRLATTLEALDTRRHELLDPRYQFREHARGTIVAAVGVVVSLIGGLAAAYYHSRETARHPFRTRWRALVRAWQHPERLAVRSPERPFIVRFFEKAVLALVSAGASRMMRRES